MQINTLLQLTDLFHCLAHEAEKLPENSKNLNIILDNLEKLKTYSARKKYAEQTLKHLSSGSSRVVYLTSTKTVIKLASNDKGIAQNEAEARSDMKSKFINPVLRHAKNYAWIESEYLEKITPSQFEKLSGISLQDFDKIMHYTLRDISENKEAEKPQNYEKLKNIEIVKDLTRVGKKFKLLPGDMARISSMGEKDGHPVLIDAGLTKKIFEDFYQDSGSSS